MESSEPIREYESWGIDEVCNWLNKTVALPQYKPIFTDLAIDGSLLSHILKTIKNPYIPAKIE